MYYLTEFQFSSSTKLLYFMANQNIRHVFRMKGEPEENQCPSFLLEWIFDAIRSRSTSVCHRVEDPVHVINDPSVDSRDARGTTLPHPVTNHAMLNGTYCLAIVQTEGLQRPATVAETGIDVAQTTGAHLLVPDLRRMLVRFFAPLVGHQRQLRLEKLLTARA